MGREQQGAGQGFELVVKTQNSIYRNQGRARIDPNGVRGDWRVSHGKPFFKAAPRHMQPPDFAGVIQGGRYVEFDAKTTANKVKWTVGKDSLHQVEHMVETAKMGGLAFFLVEFRVHRVAVLRRVLADTPVGRITVPVTQILEAGYVDMSALLWVYEDGGVYDWLSPLEGHWL
jgi:hypothetical protein